MRALYALCLLGLPLACARADGQSLPAGAAEGPPRTTGAAEGPVVIELFTSQG
ncbi:MAG: hypothetical protein H7138_16840, partial [Myxococcales bacterium]|nr:hypothetical protein [Myxococcales bacterium]